jgi:hypothetical protein
MHTTANEVQVEEEAGVDHEMLVTALGDVLDRLYEGLNGPDRDSFLRVGLWLTCNDWFVTSCPDEPGRFAVAIWPSWGQADSLYIDLGDEERVHSLAADYTQLAAMAGEFASDEARVARDTTEGIARYARRWGPWASAEREQEVITEFRRRTSIARRAWNASILMTPLLIMFALSIHVYNVRCLGLILSIMLLCSVIISTILKCPVCGTPQRLAVFYCVKCGTRLRDD